MQDAENTQEQLITEITALRQRVAELESSAGMICRRTMHDDLDDHEARHESEARFRAIFEGAAIGIARVDHQGHPVDSNPALQQMLGYSAEELRRMVFTDFTHPDDADTDMALYQELITGQRDHYAMEKRYYTKDGQLLWGHLTVSLVRSADGDPLFAIGMVENITARKQTETALQQANDTLEARVAERTAALQRVNTALEAEITERQQAEAALRASEQRYRQLVDSSLGLICTHDLDGIMLSINPAAAQTLGYEPQAIVGKNLRVFLAASVQHLFDAYLARMRHHGTAKGLMRVVSRDGDERVLTYHNRLIEDSGEAPYVLGHAQDITARVQVETELRASEARFRQLVEGSIQGIMIHRAGTPIFANQAYATIYGYDSPEDILQVDNIFQDIIAPVDRARLAHYFQARSRGEPAPTHYTCRGVRRDGSLIWVDNIITVVTWLGETAIQCTVVDITERKRAEDERQRLEAQLRQSQKMEAIGTLAGGIAHEFNNALSVILGFTELTQRDMPPGSRAWSNLQEVLHASHRSKDLVQQILAFSHPSEHKQEPIHLALVIQEALKLLRASLPSTIEIRRQIAPDIGRVLADATQIHQVLINLCANAEYAMRESGGILEIGVDAVEIDNTFAACYPELHPGAYVCVTVRDTGSGIPPDVVERIFEPFFTTKGVGEGTGMGLAIVHGIVSSHGGAITVESKRGEGTTFSVYLPRLTDAFCDAPQVSEQVIPHGQGRLLFVDDEEVLARLGQMLLERLGYDVVVCTNGLTALEVFQQEPYQFDVVITDQTMPAMTGATLVEELRRIRSDIPIILCTGFSHLMNVEKAEALGVDAFVMKPGVTQELAVTIQQVLEKRAQQRT